MNPFHPTDTAGSGQRITDRTSKPGDLIDRRIECAQCGWLFNPDREAEGDTGGDGYTSGVQIQDVEHTFANTERSLPSQLRDVATFTEPSRTIKEPVVAGGFGCPFCGSPNPSARGRYPDIMSGGKDLSNL